jgi:hypothetical protein
MLQCDNWIFENVIKNLLFNEYPNSGIVLSNDMKCFEIKANSLFVKEQLENWLSQFEKVEIWSDCLSYDWVLFNQLFGHAFNIPKNVYYIPFDLSSLFKIYGYDPDLSRKDFSGLNEVTHNALGDAKMIKACYDKVMKVQE